MKKTLSKSDIKKLNSRVEEFGIVLGKKTQVEVVDNEIYYVDGMLALFELDSTLLPTLKFINSNPVSVKKVVVDMGAVKFVVNGADIMRPGIVETDLFEKNDFVVVVDEKNRKPLSICQALYGSREIDEMNNGKVLKNIHYVGDELWNTSTH